MTWTAIWAVWILLIAASFGVLEWLAFRTRDAEKPRKVDTLTSWIQTHLITRTKWRVHVVAGVFAAFVAWFFFHLFGSRL